MLVGKKNRFLGNSTTFNLVQLQAMLSCNGRLMENVQGHG